MEQWHLDFAFDDFQNLKHCAKALFVLDELVYLFSRDKLDQIHFCFGYYAIILSAM